MDLLLMLKTQNPLTFTNDYDIKYRWTDNSGKCIHRIYFRDG